MNNINNAVKFIFVFATLFSLVRSSPQPPEPIRAGRFEVRALPLALPAGALEIPSALSLRVTHAWELLSANREFGGVSAMHASGDALVLLSDRGALIRLLADRNARNWQADISPVPEACEGHDKASGRDTESLVTDQATGMLWIGMEIRNAICRIARPSLGGIRVWAPSAMQKWSSTAGPEAMVRLRDGRFLVFQEGTPEAELLVFDRDPLLPEATAIRLRYRPPTGYRPVDAALLPDGRLLVLNRRFALPFSFSARLTIVDTKDLREGLLLSGPVIARFEGDILGENFESISIDDDGSNLIIWLATDSNFLSIQRTLLLRLVWPKHVQRSALSDAGTHDRKVDKGIQQ